MATATKKNPPAAPDPVVRAAKANPILRVCDAVYRFLASLKLAVISLGTLAAVLAYATFFESWYGTSAVQEWIYQTKGFAILLAFLGMNILCAALIRFPWKKRQTGFVVTHAGLLVLLAGSFWSLKTADEGQVGMYEGETKNQLVRNDYPVIRVWPIDPETHKPTNEEYRLPFRPGNFAWGPGNPRPRTVFGSIFHTLTGGMFDRSDAEGEVLTSPEDPIKLVVKSHIPASAWTTAHVADPAGIPMVKLGVKVKAPGQLRPMDLFADQGEQARWLTPHSESLVPLFKRLYRVARQIGPAGFAFSYVDRPELYDDFIHPPRDYGPAGVARLRYRDSAGKTRMYEWRLDDQQDKTVTLPGSDLSATFLGIAAIPAGLERLLGDPEIPVAHFKVGRKGGEQADYYGWALMPMVPNLIPSAENKTDAPREALVQINYFLPPTLDAASGRFGLIEILGTEDGKLAYRVFGRGKDGVAEVRSVGPLNKDQEIVAFGNSPNLPMTLSFEVEDYLKAGREERVCEPITLPKGQQGQGLAASLVALTVKHDGRSTTKEFWIRRSPSEPVPEHVEFPGGEYEVVYDVDRKPLGFALKLDDFKAEFDPGTEQASAFVSKVRLTDEAENIKARPSTISMNEPLTHRGYTFYQASYVREVDENERPTGRFQSVFQVGIDPGRPVKYLGCTMIVLGAFLQFYMRAGIFTDGGKRERARAEAKARKQAQANGQAGPETSVAVVTESEETL
jgi:hypothetical protein